MMHAPTLARNEFTEGWKPLLGTMAAFDHE